MRTVRTVLTAAVSVAFALALSSLLPAQGLKTQLLAGFEPGEAKGAVEADGEVVTEHATEGEHALKMENHGQGYTSVRITNRALLAKFKDYVLLKVDVFNPQDRVVQYCMRIDDAESKGYGTRYNDENFVAPPGASLMELNITSLLRSSSKNFAARDKLDNSKLTLVNLFIGPQKEPTVLYFDNLRLESSGLSEVPGLRAFDFGPAKSAVYPGFEGVNEKMKYDADRGFGWNGAESCDRVYTPDDLTADFIRGGEFRVDLANGEYEVNVCIDPYGAWHRYPTFRWRKLALNGQTVLDEKMTGEELLEKHYYLHEDDEDLPGQDVWAKHVRKRNVVRRFEARVTDGSLTARLDSDDKHGKPFLFLVVYPKSKQAEGRQWMDELDRARRERFNRNLYVIVPKPTNPPLRPTAGGAPMVLFTRHTEEDITVQDAPSDAERKRPLALEAAQGEREHVQLGIYPLAAVKDVTVQVSDLATPDGAKIPASAVRVRKVRNFLKHMGRARAGTLLPYILLDFEKLDLTPGVTRGIWLTVSVPPDAAPGTYSGTVRVGSGAVSQSLPMTLTVLPFRLEPARDITISVTGATPGPWDYWYPELSERRWKAAEAVMRDLAEHGMNAVTGGPGAVLKGIDNGKAVIDYAEMDRWLALAAKYGLTMPGDSYQGLDVRGIPLDSKNLDANEKSARDKYGVSYADLIRVVFEDVEQHAKEKGWPQRVYYLLDEPRVEWGNIESALEMIKIWVKAAPNTLFSGYYSTGQGRDPYFETMPVSISHFNNRAAELARGAGKQLWDYDGNRARHNIGRWAFAARRAGLNGYLRNGYMYCNSDPYFDFSDDEASWCVVYPSRHDTVNAAVGWERTAQGVNDYRYLEMLDRLVKKARAAGKAAREAAAAETFIKGTLAPIELEKRETADLKGEEFDRMKHTLASHIVALRKVLGE